MISGPIRPPSQVGSRQRQVAFLFFCLFRTPAEMRNEMSEMMKTLKESTKTQNDFIQLMTQYLAAKIAAMNNNENK